MTLSLHSRTHRPTIFEVTFPTGLDSQFLVVKMRMQQTLGLGKTKKSMMVNVNYLYVEIKACSRPRQVAESIGASVSQHKDRKIETPSLPWHLCSSMNTPLDVVSGIFAPEISECIDPSGEFLCGIFFHGIV